MSAYKTIRLKLTPAQVNALGLVAVGRALASETRTERALWTKIADATQQRVPPRELTVCDECGSRPCLCARGAP